VKENPVEGKELKSFLYFSYLLVGGRRKVLVPVIYKLGKKKEVKGGRSYVFSGGGGREGETTLGKKKGRKRKGEALIFLRGCGAGLGKRPKKPESPRRVSKRGEGGGVDGAFF